MLARASRGGDDSRLYRLVKLRDKLVGRHSFPYVKVSPTGFTSRRFLSRLQARAFLFYRGFGQRIGLRAYMENSSSRPASQCSVAASRDRS